MRTEIAIISALTLVLSVPLAFGEIVETKGQNYDLVENFFTGEATWTSHPERIMDGGWQNYALSNTGDKVIFNTNAVGSFVFDKNSCSYSIYGNGFDGEQIIPSVSAVATYYSNGQWQNLPVNDEACMVSVDRYEDGVFLTSTKVITEDITEDVFIPYTGTTENFYSNSTNTNFELIQSSNGTNIGYYNGETITTTGIEKSKFSQEIRLDIIHGFKETFKIWHDGSEELGISQTVHTGESITIGDQTINIAELNGQSFDRQFIVDNEAEILELTDSINYDFDTGIESLSNINIIFDGDYKVNMDFASGNFVGYLEIDPTFTTTGSVNGGNWDFDLSSLNPVDNGITGGTLEGGTLTTSQINDISSNLGSTWSTSTISEDYKIHKFTSTGSSTFTVTAGGGSVSSLIVGGGGAGGNGGGGGGGVLSSSSTVTTGSYPIVVGTGATGMQWYPNPYSQGGDSSFNGMTAGGGGNGGYSGGGIYVTTAGSNGDGTGGAVNGYGGINGGGSGGGNDERGGGGAGNSGQTGTGTNGHGGVGIYSDITGTTVSYGDGGGGGKFVSKQIGGNGNGGFGGGNQCPTVTTGSYPVTSGTANTGGGGGGSWICGGLSGGSGIVVVRYVDDNSITATGGTVSTLTNFQSAYPTLSLNWEVPTVPQAPTGLTTVTGVPVELDWSAPTDTGNTPITGYKVFRTLNEYAFTELPDNSANSAGIDFTNNEFLTHGFDISGGTELTTTENFSSDNWTDSDSTNIGVSSGTLNWSMFRDMSNDASSLDLGSHLPDNWNLRFKVTQGSSIGSTQAGNGFHFGLSDSDNSVAQNASQDFVGMSYYYDGQSSYKTQDSDGAIVPEIYSGDSSQNFNISANDVFYFEIIKTGSDYTVEAFSNSDYSTGSLGQISGTTTASGLQYLKIMNDLPSQGAIPTSTNPFTGTIDDVTLTYIPDITQVLEDKSINVITLPIQSGLLNENTPYIDGSLYDLDDGCDGDVNLAGGNYIQDGTVYITMGDTSGNAVSEIRSFSEWDISALNGKKVTKVELELDYYTKGSIDFNIDINPVSSQVNGLTNNDLTELNALFVDLDDGTPYLTVNTNGLTGANQLYDLGSNAVTDLQNNIDNGSGYFTIGYDTAQACTSGSGDWYRWGADENNSDSNKLIVTYDDSLGTSTTGVIGTGVQNPNLSFTDSNLPDNTDDFSIGSWVKLDEQTDNIVIDWNGQGDNNDHFAKVDLGSALSDTNWVLRFTNEITAISATGGSGGNWIVIGLGDSPSIPATSTGQDFIGVLVRDDGGSANGDDISSMDSDGSTDLIYDGRDTYSTLYASNLSTGTYNTEIIRTSATAYTVNHYNSDWSSVIDTISGTTNSNNDGLRYFTVDTSQDINTGSPAYTGQVTNVQVWDGVTSATGTPESFDSLGTPLGSRVTFGTGNALATEPIGELLKLNDVTFNVGTTSASVVELATAPSYTTNFGTSTGWTVTDSEISVDTANNRIYYNGDLDTTDTSAYYDYYTSQGANLQTWTVDIDITKQSNTNNSHRTEFLITDTLGGVGVAQNAIGITTQANNDMDCRYYAGTTSTTDIGTHSTSNGVTKYVRLSYDGTTFTCDLMDSSRTSVSSSHSATVSGVDMSNARYIIISDRDNTNSSVNDVVIEFENLAVTPTNTMESSIISATGLTDNTSTPQHYTFTRSNNDWTIYQNGVSEATATDTTSLGGNIQTDSTYDTTVSGNPTYSVTGKIGNAISLDSNDYFSVPDNDNLRGLSAFSVNMWVKSANTGTGVDIIQHGNTGSGGYDNWKVRQSSAGAILFYVDGTNRVDGSTGSLSTSAFKMVTLVFDGSESGNTNRAKIYIDGAIDSGLISGSGTIPTTMPNNVFDVQYGGDGSGFDFDEVSFYDRALTANEITNLYNSGSGTTNVPTNNLIYRYNMEETSGNLENQATISADYTIHIDGMVDEYFINSDSLTSTEVEMAYEKGSEPTQIDTTGSTTTEYDDSNVTGGTEYYYTVKATNAIGDSNFLTPFVSALAGTPPQSPTSVSSTINNPNTAPLDITVSWSAPTNVGTGTLTGFEIYRDSVLIDTTGLVTSYTDTVPSGGGTFEYKLKAVSTHGTSGFSATTSTTTPTVPPAPTNAPALAINNPNPSPLDIEVSWTEPSSGGSTIQSYEVFRSATETGTYTSVGTVTDLDFTDTVPSAGTWYYKFTAINLVGSSGLSPFNSITTASVPSSPLNASSVIPSINSAPYDVTVSWDLPTSTGGSALTGYNVYRQTGTGTFSLITTTTALGYVDTVPTALNQDYTYKIHAVNNVGESTAFTTTTITTGNVPDAPTLSFTTGTTALSWTVPNSDASITGYKIFRDSSLLTTVTTTSHSDFTPINFGQSYQYEVKAVSSLGDSASSNSIVTTPETEITGMVVQGITGTGAVIDWEEPAYYQGQITSYSVYYATPATSANPTISAGTTTNTYSNFAPTLDYDTSYTFGVTVNSPLGNSGFSNLVNATTNVDSSIVAYDPNTGGMEWFDIDSVSEQTVNVIEFQRETQNLNVNGTFTDVDTLQVGYPSWWDDMTCNVDYKFAQKTEQYVEGTDMTAVVNSADANQQVIGFQFHDIDNEVIEVECAPQQSTQDDGVSAKYIMTQTDLSTGTPNIPLVTQIQAFQTGDYGTDGEFGALDVVGLFVILISMVGFNRLNPIVGVLLSASLVFGLSFFGIISLPTVLVGIVALVIFLAWGITRNR